jgi:hypothetical protein
VGSTDAIEDHFRDYFRHWNIALPGPDVASRTSGHIYEHGWHIGYVWGREHGDEYLEVLAQHRMTDDDHFRVFSSGRVEALQAPAGFYSYGPNATEADRLEAERKHVERNQRIYGELRERGLLPPLGRNLPAHEINEYLRSGGDVP